MDPGPPCLCVYVGLFQTPSLVDAQKEIPTSMLAMVLLLFVVQGLKNQVKVKLSIVSCPPVTTVLIKRPDFKFQLGFSVQNGIVSVKAASERPSSRRSPWRV